MRQHHRQPTTTVAILGTGTLSEDILARLLEREGYHVRHLEASHASMKNGVLEGVDVMLVASGLKAEDREAFPRATRSTQESAAIPVLPLSAALKVALLDELSASASWRTLLEELFGQIRDALARAATRCAGRLWWRAAAAQSLLPLPGLMPLCSRAHGA